MSTLTITTTAQAIDGAGYLRNIGRAVRALLAAFITVPHKPAVVQEKVEVRSATRDNDNMSLYRLYALASPYDSVMPNLAQELRVIASRDVD